MTGQEFSEVDFDLLADFVGGALDGTPDEAVVARRVAEEPAWAEAHAALVEATGSVRASLASWGDSAEPMPAEVADQIATALEQESHRPALAAVPGGQAGPRRTAGGARRRLPGWAGPAAIAASIAALAGFGLAQADSFSGGSDDSTAGSAAEAPAAARELESGQAADTFTGRIVPLAASGEDYRAATLASAEIPLGSRTKSSPPAAQAEDQPRVDAAAPQSLDRLNDQAALAACVDAIATAHRQGIVNVEVVDLAAYEGSPAAVVFFTDGSGARWVWASGPDCGVAGRGADTRGSAKIG